MVVRGLPGEGGRTHRHAGEAEGFYLLEGAVELLGASSTTPLVPGSFALVPPDTEHGIRIVGTAPAAWLAIWPASLDGFPEELERLTRAGARPAELEILRRQHGIEPGRRAELVMPIRLTRLARARGTSGASHAIGLVERELHVGRTRRHRPSSSVLLVAHLEQDLRSASDPSGRGREGAAGCREAGCSRRDPDRRRSSGRRSTGRRPVAARVARQAARARSPPASRPP